LNSLTGMNDFVAYHAAAAAGRTACVDLPTGRRLTYRELDRAVAKCAGWLEAELNPAAGKRVAILARNCIDTLVLHFACGRAGAILQPLNWRLPGRELAALIADAEPEILIYQSEFADAAQEAMQGARLRVAMRIADGDNPFAAAIHAAAPLPPRAIDPDAPVTFLYTSGTTGRPKGVIVTNRNAWTTCFNFALANEVSTRDVLLCDMPLFHVAGLFGVARAALFMGATVLISDRFVPSAALARMSDPKLGITHYFAVPQMAMAMLQDPGFAISDLRNLKALVIGGAPLPKVVVQHYAAHNILVVEGYGISEAGTVTAIPIDAKTIKEQAGSCGVAAPMIDIRLVTGEGADAAPGEVGEIWLRGPSVTPGYWKQPEATAKAFQDGWFKTGDAATRDGEGFYRIVDRWKDMYISGGENVYPAEIEAALAEHPAVAESAIVGVADPRWGESGCAYVVLRGGANASGEAIVTHCRERLAGYKVPKHVRFVETLPRTASGKVKKQELRHAFANSGEDKR